LPDLLAAAQDARLAQLKEQFAQLADYLADEHRLPFVIERIKERLEELRRLQRENERLKTVQYLLSPEEWGHDALDIVGQDEIGYQESYLFARIGTELLAGVGTGWLSTVSKVGWVGKLGKGVFIWDAGGNAVMVGKGGIGIAQNGLNFQNGVQVVAGLFGLGGNVAGRYGRNLPLGRSTDDAAAALPAPKGAKHYTDFADEAAEIMENAARRRGLNPNQNILNMARKADLKQIDRIAREVGGLTKGQRELLHREITKQRYSLDEIKQIAKDIKELYPNK